MSTGATKRQVTSTDMSSSLEPCWPTMALHNRRSCTTLKDNNTRAVHPLQQLEFVQLSLQTAHCVTLFESEDPVSTMSAEQPGKSSTREGMRLNAGLSLESRDPRFWTSFFLGSEMGGRTGRPGKLFPLRVFVWAGLPSVIQYIR